MSCTDLFVAAVAVGFGWFLGKETLGMLLNPPKWNPDRKILVILCWVVLLVLLFCVCYAFDNTFIPFP